MELNKIDKFANIDNALILSLRRRYASVPPLLFLRSVEKARSAGELFDILESMPDFPVVWREDLRRWVKTCSLGER